MTQNNAAQSVLTDEEIRAVWVEHGLDDEAVEDFARAIESALLSKLRVPVADERAVRDWTEDFGHENGNYQCLCHRCKQVFNGHKRRVTCKVCHAALASAPVAGEAHPPTRHCMCEDCAPSFSDAAPQASEAVHGGDHFRDATKMIGDGETVRYVAEPNRCRCHPETCCCKDYQVRDTHGKEPKITVFDLDEAQQLARSLNRAALSAQPGAQRTGGSE